MKPQEQHPHAHHVQTLFSALLVVEDDVREPEFAAGDAECGDVGEHGRLPAHKLVIPLLKSRVYTQVDDVKTHMFTHVDDVKTHMYTQVDDVQTYMYTLVDDVYTHMYTQVDDVTTHKYTHLDDVQT